MKKKLDFGVFYTCYTEMDSVIYSLKKLYEIYPEIPVYLVSDGGCDYSDLKLNFTKLETKLGKDSRGLVPKIPDDSTFLNEFWQNYISDSIREFLNRIYEAIQYCNKPYILVMEPDVLVRGELSISHGAKILGSKVNPRVRYEEKINEYLNKFGGKINGYGATPAIIESETFLSIYKFLKENDDVIKDISKLDPTLANYDILLPVVFALKGFEEVVNDEIVECLRDPNWEISGKPLVHQFRRFYPQENYKGRHSNAYY